MFKKIKDNKWIQKYKELNENPKNRDLLKIFFWILFLIVAVILVRSTTSSSEVQKLDNDKVKDVSSYEFTYRDNEKTVFGEVYKDKMIYYYGNNKYYKNEDGVYLVNDHKLEVQNINENWFNITPSFIINLTKKLSPSLEGDSKTYLVPLSNFINVYEVDTEVNLTQAMNYNVAIQTFEKKDMIYKVSLDLSNYYMFRGYPDTGVITINYYNVNKLNDFSSEYEDLLGGEV